MEREKQRVMGRDEQQDPITNQFAFDIWYAEAWSRKQGQFSFKLANNLIRYVKEHKIDIKSVLDVCSGSGEFVSVLRNICTDCVGVDNARGYLNYVQNKYHDIRFQFVEKLYDFNLKRTFDVISCNRDVVNLFLHFPEWEKFFQTVYKHLNKNGIFMFDFYTQSKLENWSETLFEQSDDLDYVSKISQNNGLCVQNEVYYVKESTSFYRKTGDVMVEAWFDTKQVLDALAKAGFKNITTLDINFEPIVDLTTAKRIHILCNK